MKVGEVLFETSPMQLALDVASAITAEQGEEYYPSSAL